MLKDHEERKQEILQRSRVRIAKRRRERKMLACCACLLLTGAVLAGRVWEPAPNEAAQKDAHDVGYDTHTPAGMADESVLEYSTANIPAENQPMDDSTQEENAAQCYGENVQGLELEIGELDLQNGSLTAALSNFTGATAFYGWGFDVEYRAEEGWNSCQQEGVVVTTECYALQSGDTVTARYVLDSFDLSEPGEYRLVKYVELEEEDGCCKVVAEFTVEEEAP